MNGKQMKKKTPPLRKTVQVHLLQKGESNFQGPPQKGVPEQNEVSNIVKSPNPQGSVRKRIRFGTPKKSDAWNTAMCEGMTKTKDEYTQVSAGDFLDLDQDDSSRIDKTVQEMIDLLPRVLVELRDLD